MEASLVLPAFLAGILTFLAPCTLPLLPGYLAFISGVSAETGARSGRQRRLVFVNGLAFVAGFSAVFIFFGTAVGFFGTALAEYRLLLGRIGGAFVILFGLFLLGSGRLPFLAREFRLRPPAWIRPGRPLSSLLFGITFSLGWTPCVGPILGSVLTLAAAHSTAGEGAVLLGIFSLGLALPFLFIAGSADSGALEVKKLGGLQPWISIVGSLFLVVLGVLMLTNTLGLWVAAFFRAFAFAGYDRLLDLL